MCIHYCNLLYKLSYCVKRSLNFARKKNVSQKTPNPTATFRDLARSIQSSIFYNIHIKPNRQNTPNETHIQQQLPFAAYWIQSLYGINKMIVVIIKGLFRPRENISSYSNIDIFSAKKLKI